MLMTLYCPSHYLCKCYLKWVQYLPQIKPCGTISKGDSKRGFFSGQRLSKFAPLCDFKPP